MAIKIPKVQTADRLINQLQQNVASTIEPIFQNLTGQFVVTLTGCTTSPQAIVYWQRPTAGGPVTMNIPSVTGESNTGAATLTGLPTNLWPTRQQVVLLRVYNNGTSDIGIMVISVTGTITLYKDSDANNFTTSGGKGTGNTTITYATAN